MALRASTERTGDRGDGGWYEGVLRDGKAIVWRCGHSHKTRDCWYPTRPSAKDCAQAELRGRLLAQAATATTCAACGHEGEPGELAPELERVSQVPTGAAVCRDEHACFGRRFVRKDGNG